MVADTEEEKDTYRSTKEKDKEKEKVNDNRLETYVSCNSCKGYVLLFVVFFTFCNNFRILPFFQFLIFFLFKNVLFSQTMVVK